MTNPGPQPGSPALRISHARTRMRVTLVRAIRFARNSFGQDGPDRQAVRPCRSAARLPTLRLEGQSCATRRLPAG